MSARIDKKTMDTLSHTNHLVDELREAVSSANEALFESRQQLEQQRQALAKEQRLLGQQLRIQASILPHGEVVVLQRDLALHLAVDGEIFAVQI